MGLVVDLNRSGEGDRTKLAEWMALGPLYRGRVVNYTYVHTYERTSVIRSKTIPSAEKTCCNNNYIVRESVSSRVRDRLIHWLCCYLLINLVFVTLIARILENLN